MPSLPLSLANLDITTWQQWGGRGHPTSPNPPTRGLSSCGTNQLCRTTSRPQRQVTKHLPKLVATYSWSSWVTSSRATTLPLTNLSLPLLLPLPPAINHLVTTTGTSSPTESTTNKRSQTLPFSRGPFLSRGSTGWACLGPGR